MRAGWEQVRNGQMVTDDSFCNQLHFDVNDISLLLVLLSLLLWVLLFGAGAGAGGSSVLFLTFIRNFRSFMKTSNFHP